MVSTFSGKHKLGVLKKTTSVLKLDFHKISWTGFATAPAFSLVQDLPLSTGDMLVLNHTFRRRLPSGNQTWFAGKSISMIFTARNLHLGHGDFPATFDTGG
jgi:hypothetical protein